MGRLSKPEEGVGEINTMYTRPKHRGKGYATETLKRLEEKAREFGRSTLRLDTKGFKVVAQHLYRKIGFKEIERYSGIGAPENETRAYTLQKNIHRKEMGNPFRKVTFSYLELS